MVKLPQTGAVLLSGDAVHLKDNWDAKRVSQPSMSIKRSRLAGDAFGSAGRI
jgi:N-acyl homoserine lactone hydrolase